MIVRDIQFDEDEGTVIVLTGENEGRRVRFALDRRPACAILAYDDPEFEVEIEGWQILGGVA